VRNHLALSFGQKSISFPSFECTPWESNMLQGTYFILVESMPQVYKSCVSNFMDGVWNRLCCIYVLN